MEYMNYIYLLFAAAFGLVVGSFLNVVIYRLPRPGFSIARPARSFCPSCRVSIGWYDNIPVLSWLVLGGRCRYCGGWISGRYMLVELLTGALFVASTLVFAVLGETPDWPLAFAAAAFGCLMVAVSFIDVDYRVIPDELSTPAVLLALVASAFIPGMHAAEAGHAEWFISDFLRLDGWLLDALGSSYGMGLILSLFGMVVGYAAIVVIRFVASAIAGREAMGMGDAKLMAAIGAFAGWRGALGAIILGAFLGAIIAPAVRMFARSRDPKIAFGPFLALGGLVFILLKSGIIEFATETYPAIASKHPDALAYVMLAVSILLIVYLAIFRMMKKGGTGNENT